MNRRQFLKVLGVGAATSSFDFVGALKSIASYIPKPVKKLAFKSSDLVFGTDYYSEHFIKPAAQALADAIDRDIMSIYLKHYEKPVQKPFTGLIKIGEGAPRFTK